MVSNPISEPREIVEGLRALSAAGAIQIWVACVATWSPGDIWTWTRTMSGSMSQLKPGSVLMLVALITIKGWVDAWELSCHWGNLLHSSATLSLGPCRSGWLVMPTRSMMTSRLHLLPGTTPGQHGGPCCHKRTYNSQDLDHLLWQGWCGPHATPRVIQTWVCCQPGIWLWPGPCLTLLTSTY